ncbi:PHP domain-containing protein [Candidatus Woesearchaeota archaeon]|jgi:histidinol phosphatase-like PHP family hydrolase|nr:PHP domain-containing protein [Candidatus Woesearchaeota archaeon]
MGKIILKKPDIELLNKQGYNCVDLHTHTTYSDGTMNYNEIIKHTKKLKIGFSITDHNLITGAIKACAQNKRNKNKQLIIPGIEVTTDKYKDLLFYFYDIAELIEFYSKIKKDISRPKLKKVPKKIISSDEILDISKQYNCLSSIPHPFCLRPKRAYKYFQKKPTVLKKIDAIEVINSILKKRRNEKAILWNLELEKAFTGGSDAHRLKDLGNVITGVKSNTVEDFLNGVLKKKNVVMGAPGKIPKKILSQIRIAGTNIKIWSPLQRKPKQKNNKIRKT